MNIADFLALLFQFSLFKAYAPIINAVGFSHPATFAIILAHNTFCLVYLFIAAAVAWPVFKKKTWCLPLLVAITWVAISGTVLATSNLSPTVAVAAILPHGWLEFLAIFYWTRAIRRAVETAEAPRSTGAPGFSDYAKVFSKPGMFLSLARSDVSISLKMMQHSLTALRQNLKKPFLQAFGLLAVAALIEAFVTPYIVILV
ncbi:MAG: stage II sporulation protein M [Candidatus Bathyarchaeota archaeon]|nr:MAG: stage II sporulation protein M [Candidatus Bathyarchaeota archaeon]